MSEQPPVLPPPSGQPVYPPPSGPPAYPAFRPQGPGWNGPPPSNTMAIVALVLSFVPLGITAVVALILACIVLSRVRKGEARGRGMAVAALIISILWLVLITVLVVIAVRDEVKQGNAREAGTGEISVTKMRVGDCVTKIPDTTAVSTVDIVQCAKPHVGEVYATFDLDTDKDADQDTIDRLAEEGCVSHFAAFVGKDYSRSKIEVFYLRPMKGSLTVDDGVACFLTSPANTTGSLKGSKR
ncbi:DUF4190 domain-containing protein [Nocardioides marmoriginsengisoli]|nr:DUF4190 domain-containing protein [Nocardioides marmoriginsengisoli]